MPLVREIKRPMNLPAAMIENCESKEDAIRLCWSMRRSKGMTQTKAAELMGLSKAQMSKILDGLSGMRGNQERAFQYLCGNRAIAQFQAFEQDCELVDKTWAARQENRVAA